MRSAGGDSTIPQAAPSSQPPFRPAEASTSDIDRRGDEKPFRPRAFLLDNVHRLAMRSHSTAEIVRLISSRAMRYSLYSQLFASGSSELDGVEASVEWSLAVLIYSGFNMTHQVFLGDRLIHHGYPRFVKRLQESPELFRIYTRSRAVAESIVEGGKLLASHKGHIIRPRGIVENYIDLTGVFLTRPDVEPSRVWLENDSHRHFVDFKLPSAVPLLALDSHGDALLIPGPARFASKEIERAATLPFDAFHESHPLWDAALIFRAFGSEPPEFSIPIEPAGLGELDAGSGQAGPLETPLPSTGLAGSMALGSTAWMGRSLI